MCVGLVCVIDAEGRAEPLVSAGPTCPPGNLLAGRLPSGQEGIRGQVSLVTDGTAAVEGTVWNAPLAVVLPTLTSQLTYDLGTVMPLQVMYVQADANDAYTISGSVDGQVFRLLGQIDPVEGAGLRSRPLNLGGVRVRYVRVGQGQGDGNYSVSEIQAFCQVPTPFPPDLPTKSAQAAQGKTGFKWDNDSSARWELILALLGLALLGWGHLLARRGHPGAYKKLRDRILMVFGVTAALTYVNFGSFHFPNFIHNWDTYHYYVGSKYFSELGYTRLYDCVAVSDAEDPALRRRVAARRQTNLRTNVLEPTTEILAHPERCTERFTPERWAAFKHDTAFFRMRESPARWDDAQTDHGFNGTPVWNIAGTLLANLAPASIPQVRALTLIDEAYLAAMILVVWWGFGWRVLSLALLVFATNFPSRFYWTGGSFLRWDWLFYTVASVCCVKKDRPLLGGMSLAYATLLRIFPGFLFVGPLLALGYHVREDRRLERQPGERRAGGYVRFFVGAALASAVLIPTSLVTSGGIEGYREFIANTTKHMETPLTNHMGLRTVVAFRPWETALQLRSNSLMDPLSTWKEARLRSFTQARPIFVLLLCGFLVLLFRVAKDTEPWVVVACSAMMIAVGVELTSYYYAFVMAVALLYAKNEAVGIWLLLLTAFTQAVAAFSSGARLDVQYTLMSVGTLIIFGRVLWSMARAKQAAAP